MDPIPGINLPDIVKGSEVAARKMAEATLAGYVRGLMLDCHNLDMKALRLRQESEKAQEAASARRQQLLKITQGDWSAIEPFELTASKPETK
jgi:hypothetical protein